MANRLLGALRANSKNKLFERSQTAVSYSTGFLPFDFRNGYIVEVQDIDGNHMMEYPAIGLTGGSFVTIIGKSGTAKTTFAIQAASNIVRPFKNGTIIHFDLEQATNYTRIRNVTNMGQREMYEKYVLRQEKISIEKITTTLNEIVTEKTTNRKEYEYDTGLFNEFGQPIIALAPTVCILDSIPSITTDDQSMEIEGGTYANRIAKANSQFYKKMVSQIKAANIIFISINHINAKIEINPMSKTAPQLLHMKMDESLPGGNAPIYYAQNILKFVSRGAEKRTIKDNGFDGFGVDCMLLKSRSNKAGQMVKLVFDQQRGFDSFLTLYEYANDHGLIIGKNPRRRITGAEDVEFDSREFDKIINDPALRERLEDALTKGCLPLMQRELSTGSNVPHSGELDAVTLLRILDSQDNEF